MRQLLLAVVALLCVSTSAQTINPNQIRPSTTNGQVLTTVGGVTLWSPSAGGAGFPVTNGVVFNTSTSSSRNSTFSDIVLLWNSGCTGALWSTGICANDLVTTDTNQTITGNKTFTQATIFGSATTGVTVSTGGEMTGTSGGVQEWNISNFGFANFVNIFGADINMGSLTTPDPQCTGNALVWNVGSNPIRFCRPLGGTTTGIFNNTGNVGALLVDDNAMNTEFEANGMHGGIGALANATGLQLASTAACNAAANSSCGPQTFNLSVVESDTSYKIYGCTVMGNTGGAVIPVAVAITSTTTFTAFVQNLTSTASTGGTINCLVAHN
jgi:hypothetical protein